MMYFIILAFIISVVLYYRIGELFRQMQKRTVRRRVKRLVVCALIVGLLVGQADLVNFLTKTGAETVAAEESDVETGEAGEVGSRMIVAFAELPDDVREQTVPVGTTLDELILPDILEAVVVTDTDTDADTDEGINTDTDEDTDSDADVDSDTDTDEGTDIGGDADVNPDVSVDADTDKEADVDPDVDTDTDADIDTSNDADANADTYTDTYVIPDNDRLADIDDTEGDTEKVETFYVTMPEYRTGNVIEVKTLEMAPAANYETIEETIIIENITWQPESEYYGDTEGEYVFTAILPQGYVLTSGVDTPQITVTVGGTDDTALLSGDGIMPIAEEHEHNGITFTAWTDTTSLPDVYANDSYYLTTDVTINQTWIPKGNITLCLNGHTVMRSASGSDSNAAISVNNNRVFNIYDCQGRGTVKTSDRNCIHIAGYGTANIYGGIFNSDDNTHPAIVVAGTVTIENASVYGPGAVNIQSYGTANIYGGTFETTASEPTITTKANVSLKITGGTFIRNNGGNVIQNQDGRLEMSGGTVIGRRGDSSGAVGILNYGGEATIKNVTVTTEGTATDDDTKADKGLRNDNGGTMTVENCNITSSNRAVWNTGGSTIKISSGTFNGRYGMYNNNGTFELSGSPTISGSTADIYLSNNQKITVTGTLGNATPYSVLTQTNPAVGSPVVITDSSNTSYNNADKFTPANNSYILRKNSSSQLELAALATYTITYNAGSHGSGSVSSGTKTEGVDYTLSSDTFTRTGYTQTGWSKNSSGSTKDYALGAIYTDDASITLYPYWTANQYTVSFNSAGGSSVSTTMKVTYDSTYGNLPETTRAGYTFDGWYTAETGGTKVESNTKVTIADDHTLYAKWTAKEYDITYMDQGGAAFSGTHESGYPTKHTYGTATTLKTASKTGFTFSGWYTNSSCTGSAVTSLGATGYTSNITLYAKWTGPEYDIIYMDQGGEAFSGTHESGYPTKHAYGTATTLKFASKTGYIFGGWYTDSSCTNKVTSLGATDYTSDITLYTKWTEGTAPPKTDGGSSSGGGGSTGGNSSGSSSGSGNGSQSSENNNGGTGTGNNTAGGTQTGTDTSGSTQAGTDTSGNTQTGTDTTANTQADRQTGTGTRNERNNSTETNRAGALSSTSTDNQSSQPTSADAATNSTAGASSETGRDAGRSDASGTDGRTTGSTSQTVKAETKDGKITVEGDAVVTGTVRTAETTTMTLTVGEGAVIVTVVSDEYKGNAGVADTLAVANAVLTPEQIQRVNGGETIEIRVDVKDISSQVSQEDKDIIESGLAVGGTDGEETEELILGAYIDISMYIRIGDGDWDAITRADEPIEVVIGIPEELQGDGRTYYIARVHEGEYALLEDMDNEPDTITIKTGMFSTYAVVFKQMPGTGADASSGFLASLSWTAAALWSLGILVMIALAVILILWKRRKEEDDAS